MDKLNIINMLNSFYSGLHQKNIQFCYTQKIKTCLVNLMNKNTLAIITLLIILGSQLFNTENSSWFGGSPFFSPEDVEFLPLPKYNSTGQWYEISQIRSEVNKMVAEKNFARLEQMVNQVREEKLRFNTVVWVLHDLYNAIPYALDDFDEIDEFVMAWRAYSPLSNIPDIIEARAYFAHGSKVRGNGYSSSVSEDQYRSYKYYLNKSWDSASLAEKKGPDDAELCSLQTELAFALFADKKMAKQYFNHCLKIEPGYFHLYFKVNRYLQPIWFGSHNEHEQFVNDAANANQSLYGDGLYALLVSASSFYTGKIFEGYGGSFVWNRAQAGFKDLLSEYGESSYIYHLYAYCAMLAHDHQALAEVLQVIGIQWDDDKTTHFKKKSWYEYHLNKAKLYIN